MAYFRLTGHENCKTYNSAGTITANDLVQFDENGEVIAAVTGAEVLGIAKNAGTSSTAVLVDMLTPNCVIECTDYVGTADGTEIGEEADIVNGQGGQATLTESNNDFLIVGWNGVGADSDGGRLHFVCKNVARG